MGVSNAIEAIFGIIFWALVVYVIFYCCCKKKKDRGVVFTTVQPVPAETTRTVIGPGGNITSTTMHSTAYVANSAPYPVQQGPYGAASVGLPYPAPPAYPAAAPYPAGPSPYPAPAYPPQGHGGHGMGMPQPYQGMPGAQAPPYPVGANPPPYDQVVSPEGYQKQAPYNPHYGGN